MINAPVQIEKMTLEEFVRLYETEGAFEIVNGERVKLMPPLALHAEITRRLLEFLQKDERVSQTGFIYTETPFVLTYSSDWVRGSRVPDIMFYRAERMIAYKAEVTDWEEKPFVLVPDVVIEIVSKNDSYTEIDEKVAGYLRDGVKLVLVVDPRRKMVIVHRPNEQPLRLTGDEILSGGDVLSGFELTVSKIFE